MFYFYMEISSINYENIVVQFFNISFGNERLGGELTGKVLWHYADILQDIAKVFR